jgi:hypothetical protein
MNNWDWNHSLIVGAPAVSDRQTRGGPRMTKPGVVHWSSYGETDGSKKLYYSLAANYNADAAGGWDWSLTPTAEWKPVSALLMRVGPSVSHGVTVAQYVGQYSDPLATSTYGVRYVFAHLEQSQVSANVTLNWSFTPTLSLQMFAQPLIAAGRYSRFKELSRPNSYDFLVYGENGSTFRADSLIADPDGAGPAAPIAIGSQDFHLLSLRGNAVLRWEYRPGSALFLVWTQTRSQDQGLGDFELGRSLDQLSGVKPNNIFLVKVSYYLGL